MGAFQDKVVLITGAGSGIGRQLALILSGEGARIAALDRSQEGLNHLSAALAASGAHPTRLAWAVAEVTDLAAVRAAVSQLEQQLGPPDILVASAGLGRGTPATLFSAEDINSLIEVNLIGVVNSIDAVLPGMCMRRRGHLVGISSLASYRGMPLMAGYCASKAGLNALFVSLRVELKPLGNAVTTICPGWISTPMTASLGLPARELMSVEKAAGIIAGAIRQRRPFIAFPRGLTWQLRLLRYLPRPLSDWLAQRHLEKARKLLKGL